MDHREESLKVQSQTWIKIQQHTAICGSSSEDFGQWMLDQIKEICQIVESALKEDERKKIDRIRAIIQEIVQLSQDLSIQPPLKNYAGKTLSNQETELMVTVGILRTKKEMKVNPKKFIIQLRLDLQEMWKKCFVSTEDQEAFFEIDSTDYSEELLKAHEAEVQKWKEFHSGNEEMVESIQQHESARVKLLELEALEDDPGRLRNRGGYLLKHEEEKKKLGKLLRQSEARIKAQASHSFHVYGIPVLEYLRGQKALDERDRQERKLKNKENRMAKKNTGTSSSTVLQVQNASKRGALPRPPCGRKPLN